MTIRYLQRALMILGSKVAAEFRVLIEGVFTRVMAGDQSLIEVINENAASNAPVQQAYRQALAQEPVVSPAVDELSLTRKRRMEELQIERLEMELESKKMDIKRGEVEIQERRDAQQSKKLADIKLFTDIKTALNPRWISEDVRLRIQTEDWLRNVAFPAPQAFPAPLAIANGVGASLDSRIYIQDVAKEMGKHLNHGQSIQAGGLMAKKYFEKYGEKPPKEKRWVDNAERSVCSYTARDRDMMEQVLRSL